MYHVRKQFSEHFDIHGIVQSRPSGGHQITGMEIVGRIDRGNSQYDCIPV